MFRVQLSLQRNCLFKHNCICRASLSAVRLCLRSNFVLQCTSVCNVTGFLKHNCVAMCLYVQYDCVYSTTVFAVLLCSQCVSVCRAFLCCQCSCVCSASKSPSLTRPVALGCQFRCVDDAVDGGLGDGVLLLQQLDSLPQLVELRVLWKRERRRCGSSTGRHAVTERARDKGRGREENLL